MKDDKEIKLELILNEIGRLKSDLAIEMQTDTEQSYINNLKYEISVLEKHYHNEKYLGGKNE